MTGRRPFRRLVSSVRTRFAFAYAALLAGTGLVLVALFYAYVRVAGLVQVGTRPTVATGVVEAPAVEAVRADPLLTDLGFLTFAALLIVLAMWIGWLIAGRLLRPLDAIHQAARRVSQGDMTMRAALAGPDDEFAQLARVFNGMLDRIQQSLETHRRFAANASHELRTPLATNKAMLSVALDRPEDTDFVELARRLRTVNQHSIDTVEALLDLADAEQPAAHLDPVDLAELAREQIDVVRAEADAKRIAISHHLDPAPARGSPVLLSRVLANLLQNAVRHNVVAGRVVVRTGRRNGAAHVRIENTGPTVPDDLVGTLTEPFVRHRGRAADMSEGGLGLGLAIVASIARAHGARMELEPRIGGGLAASFSLPSPDLTTFS